MNQESNSMVNLQYAYNRFVATFDDFDDFAIQSIGFLATGKYRHLDFIAIQRMMGIVVMNEYR